MPMLYEGRQHKRATRESLDCALALQELTSMGVENIISFDIHDPRVQNAIPLHGFEDFHPYYQMIKAFVRAAVSYTHLSSSERLYPVGLLAGVFNMVTSLFCLFSNSSNFSLKDSMLNSFLLLNNSNVVAFLPLSLIHILS